MDVSAISQVSRWATADLAKQVATCEMIADDLASDVKRLDRAPFTGATVGEMHGILSAAIAALAEIVGGLAVKLDQLAGK